MRLNKARAITETEGMPLPGRYLAILTIALGVSTSVITGTITNVALPTISRDLSTDPSMTIWVVNAFQLATMVALLSFSSLGEIYGYRRIYLFGLGLFSITSLLCALSTSFWMLTLSRVLQGFGAAAINSVNTALLRIIYPKQQLGRGMGINAFVVAVSIAAGPTFASAILSLGSWHWLFAVNIPFAVAAFILGVSYLPLNPAKTLDQKFDITNSMMNALTFALLIFTMESIAHDCSRAVIIALALGFIVVCYSFVHRQLRQAFPILPLDLLRIPIFSLSIINSIFSFMAQMLAMISLPFLLQNSLGRSDVATGLLFTAWPIASMVAAPAAGYLVEKIHPGILGAIGMLTFASGLFLLTVMPSWPSDMDIMWRLAVCGAGFSLFQTPNNSTIISSAPVNRSGGASGMLSMARLLGQTIGATLVSMLFGLAHDRGTQICLYLAFAFAIIAAIISCIRISQPAPIKGK